MSREQLHEAEDEAGGMLTTLRRMVLYTLRRGAALLITVTVGVYLTIVIANMGGHVDEIRKAQIRERVGARLMADEQVQSMSAAERRELMERHVEIESRRQGLDRPFVVRSFLYLRNAMTLNLGRAENLTSDSGSRRVRLILLERLPATLLLFAPAQMLVFFVSIFAALYLSRRYGSWLDRLVVTLTPTSTAPAWFYGIFLILIFARLLGVLPFGGMVATPPPEDTLPYVLSVAKHMILPVGAMFIGGIFISVYYWRTFFLIHAREDYVEMARAKGLSSGQIERRYILRPTLPTILTSFALSVITLWMGSIVLEIVFRWPGLGRMLFKAIGMFDTPVIVGSVVIYAYLLAATVFVLDVVYAIIDPRVRAGQKEGGR
ncbi:MAG: ABC transporter permease [Planctomycetota bacterium]